MTLASAVPLENNKGFTYKDYLQWDDDRRWELIDGIAFNMTPAPSRKHQQVSMELAVQIANFLKGKQCEVYAAPFDVRLPEKDEPDDEIKTVVQPDISVICDKTKLDDRGCRGAPDLIIEIVSPFTARKDLKDKMFLYERCGVKEYWIVHPEEKILMRYKLENNRYGRAEIFSQEDTLRTVLLEGLEIELAAVFSE
jgi:Uma2 family endonuclease